MSHNSWTASPQWRKTIPADDFTTLTRSTSNNSLTSTSSEILVAGGPTPLPSIPPSYLQQPTSIAPMAPIITKATVIGGRMLRATFVGLAAQEKLRAILRTKPSPQLSPSDSTSSQPESDDEDENNFKTEADGLDPLKTYSKQETLSHPGVEFVHRGQGRYRMVTAIQDTNSPATLPRPTR